MDNEKMYEKMSEAIETIKNLSQSQITMSETMLKQKEIDLTLARAIENNSIVNLRLADTMIEDKEMTRRLIDLIEEFRNK